VQRVHEREDARLLLLRLLDHDADAEIHERLAEVDDSLAYRRNCQRRNGYIRLLDTMRSDELQQSSLRSPFNFYQANVVHNKTKLLRKHFVNTATDKNRNNVVIWFVIRDFFSGF